jgi:hypothetical protein
MAEIRFNYGDKFTQTTDTNTGIGSTIPSAKLDIAGGASAGSLRVSGIATLSSYQGFVNTKLSTTEDLIVEAGQSGSVSGEVVIGTGQTISVSTGATTGQGGVQSLKVYETFMPPVGGTADRPTDVKPGMVYYNKDFKTIEFWDGNFWKQVDNTTTRGRGLVFGGYPSAGGQVSTIDYFNIQSQGNSLSFGDLIAVTRMGAGLSSNTRGICAVSYPSPLDQISYVTIASEGDSIDFGNLTSGRQHVASLSSSTRGIFAGGAQAVNIIEYIEINTLGDALDFGDLVNGRRNTRGAASPTRGVITAGGEAPNFVTGNEFITIASKGNGTDFGAVNGTMSGIGAGSNGIRGIFAGGYTPTKIDKITHVTMASLGNVVNFGTLSLARQELQVLPDKTRAVFTGGWGPAPAPANVINTTDFILFSSGGSATDFGDLSTARAQIAGCTDSHGGLGGF